MPPFVASILVGATLLATTARAEPWRALLPGVDYRVIQLTEKPKIGDGRLHVVRIDPARATLTVGAASLLDRTNRTAAAWCQHLGLAVAINAGMFETDYSTHTGYFRQGTHLNNPRWVKTYQSVLLIGPRRPGLAAAAIFDRDQSGGVPHADYDLVIQNLRLLKSPGQNVWSENRRRWSEAAIAQDKAGAILFLFTRTPYSMRELNRRLVRLDLGIQRAQHVEGGPEASLSIHAGGIDLDLHGSYETAFSENDDNARQWEVPNVIGVVAPPKPTP